MKPRLIDVGINLMNSSYDRDRDEVVKSAAAAGVWPLVITGSGERSSLDAALYASRNKLFSTVGVHPHEVKNCGNETLSFLRSIVKEKSDSASGVRAIGECGLDYNRDFSPRDVQRRWFVKQAELAADLKLPLFMHERDAFGSGRVYADCAGLDGLADSITVPKS